MENSESQADLNRRLFGESFTPIYIYAPKYVSWSAGIRALHYLCHALNQNGFHAWIALHGPKSADEPITNPFLDTPVLTKRIVKDHHRAKLATVGIYPESVDRNPLNTSVTVRWLLNIPGLLGGALKYEDDFVVSYSKYIADEYQKNSGQSVPVLFLPVVDTRELDKYHEELRLTGEYSLLYCQKFRALGGNPELQGKNVIEIERFGKNGQPREKTLSLLSKSRELIAYENSTIISEAQYFGIPVHCVSNEWFSNLIAEAELGSDGVYWDSSSYVGDPAANSEKFKLRLEESIRVFLSQVSVLAQSWGFLALKRTPSEIALPANSVLSAHSLYRAKAVYESIGFKGMVRFGWSYLRRACRWEASRK